jgi:hypothetical protein
VAEFLTASDRIICSALCTCSFLCTATDCCMKIARWYELVVSQYLLNLSRRSKRIVTIFGTALFLFVLVFGYYMPHSAIWNTLQNSEAMKAHMVLANNLRLEHSLKFLKTMASKQKNTNDVKRHTDVLITVIALSRKSLGVDSGGPGPQYLTQVISRLLELQLSANLPDLSTDIVICNVDDDPLEFSELELVSQHAHVVSRFQQRHFSLVHPLEKEKQDYVFCLNTSLQYQPKFVLLVEDDAMPASDLFQVLLSTVRTNLELVHFIKLFHPERLIGYLQSPLNRIPELFASALLCALVQTLFLLYCFKLPKSDVNVLFVYIYIYDVMLLLVIGRSAVLQLLHVMFPHLHFLRRAPSCCTPAILYPSNSAQRIASYMDTRMCSNNYGKDSVLDDYVRLHEGQSLLLEPNSFTHIGMYSSLRKQFVDPLLV